VFFRIAGLFLVGIRMAASPEMDVKIVSRGGFT
jgi:hypothetical protein